MTWIPGQGVTVTAELDPERAPGEFTEIGELSGVDLATADALAAMLFEPPFEAALRGAAASISVACAVPDSLLRERHRPSIVRLMRGDQTGALCPRCGEPGDDVTCVGDAGHTFVCGNRNCGVTEFGWRQPIYSEPDIHVEMGAREVADEETLTAEEIRRSIEIATAIPPARAGGAPRLFSASPVRGRDRVWADSLSSISSNAERFAFSVQEFNEAIVALSETYSAAASKVNSQAEARAEAFLSGLLTPGEQRCLKRLKIVPVIGAETGDLWLVSRRGSYNLLRYERFGHLPKPVLYCVSAGRIAPSADLVSSLVLSLRGPEGGLLEKANRFNLSSSLNMYSFEPGRAESELYPDLWALAHVRCEDKGLLRRTIRRASRMESLA